MKLDELKNKNILILGYGIEGQSTMRFLKHMLPGQCTIDIGDQKNGSDYLEKQKHYDLIIRSPGISKRLITRSHTTATNIFFANAKGKIIGVTGSKGKSTTASLMYAFLKEAGHPVKLVGNIGNPMLDTLIEENISETIYVVELSSYQLDDINYSPHVSVITNLFPEHMDYHGSVHEYWQAKKRIVARVNDTDYFVFNPDYKELVELARTIKAKSLPFVSEMPFSDNDIPLVGTHNRDNIRAAVTASLFFNVSYSEMESALKQFKGLPHRLEKIGTFNDITFYDDAISTTPESTIAALRSLAPIGALFLGGKDRGYNFSKLASLIVDLKIPNIVLFPDSGSAILRELEKMRKSLPCILQTRSMKGAVTFAYLHSPKGSICLLSSASPSYSLWKNFEEKGRDFQECVRELGTATKNQKIIK